MQQIGQDVRFAFRMLVKQPGLAAIIVLTLALGLGANAAVFAILDALVIRPFPIRGIQRLVMVMETSPRDNFPQESVAPANFLDWRAQNTVFDRLAAQDWWDVNLTGRDEPERVQGFRVTRDFFATLGVTPAIGRTFVPEEDVRGHDRVVVLGYGLWQRRFASDRSIVGRSILLDAEPYTVVGIAPSGFDYPMGAEVWSPLTYVSAEAAPRDRRELTVIGHLRDGVTLDQAQAEMGVISDRLRQRYPVENASHDVRVLTLTEGVTDVGSGPFLAVLQLSALLVLLIACANVANLLLARGTERQREMAVRLAMGASRGRLVRLMLTESAVLSALAVPAALAIAWASVRVIRSAMPANIARFVTGWRQLDVDGRLIAVTAILAVASSIVFGVLPALRASRPALTETLKDGGRGASAGAGRQRTRQILAVAQVALALALLVGSGLSVMGSWRFIRGPQGFNADNVLTMRLVLPGAKYADMAARRQFASAVLEQVAAIPGVDNAALANTFPGANANSSADIWIEGRPKPDAGKELHVDYRTISPLYFRTLQVPLVRGRDFTSVDREDAPPVAIISQSMAERYWPGQDPLGKRFRPTDEAAWLTIVGVTGDVIQDWFARRNYPTMYRPFRQQPRLALAILLRTRGEPTSLVAAAKAGVRHVDPNQPVYEVRSMRRALSDRTIGLQYAASIMTAFGVLALLLATVGVYSLLAFFVAQRTHEIGVRMALGASSRDVFRLTIGQAGRLTAAGVVVGLALALMLGRVMASLMFGAVAVDVRVFALFAVTLSAFGLLAGYVPARRAVHIDPSVALRSE